MSRCGWFAIVLLSLLTFVGPLHAEESPTPAFTPTVAPPPATPVLPASSAPVLRVYEERRVIRTGEPMPVDLSSESRGSSRSERQPRFAPPSPFAPQIDPNALQFQLMDGTMIVGKLAIKEIEVETEFGKLKVAVDKIRSLTPGLESHPRISEQIGTWVEQLGSGSFSEREAAQQGLENIGPQVSKMLEKYRDDSDAERRTRVRAVLSELDQADSSEDNDDQSDGDLLNQKRDTLQTNDFTIVGKILVPTFEVVSPYGRLSVKLGDIRRIERPGSQPHELRENFTVDGNHLTPRGQLRTSLKLEKGDRVSIVATGRLTMIRWGGMQCTPEGAQSFGWYIPGQIPSGALIGKIGTGQSFFKVGNKHTFTAERSGELILAVGMQSEIPGETVPGRYTVKVHVVRKGT